MALSVNGQQVSSVYINGQQMKRVFINGQQVFGPPYQNYITYYPGKGTELFSPSLGDYYPVNVSGGETPV